MKTAVITGAGGVLCSAFARHLASLGYALALLDINEAAVRLLADEIKSAGGKAFAYKVDVLDKESLESAHAKILKDLGPCDILINGAGGNHPSCTTAHEFYQKGDEDSAEKSFFNITPDDFRFVFDLNLTGALLTTQVFAVDMLGRTGCSVVNISSMNAFRPLTKIPAYSAAKSGVSNFTQWLAVHFAKEGIRVNAIAPGFFVTAQNKDMLYDKEGSPTPRTGKILAATPMGRFGKPEELLGALDFLICPEKAGFITGVILPVDGGFSAYSGV